GSQGTRIPQYTPFHPTSPRSFSLARLCRPRAKPLPPLRPLPGHPQRQRWRDCVGVEIGSSVWPKFGLSGPSRQLYTHCNTDSRQRKSADPVDLRPDRFYSHGSTLFPSREDTSLWITSISMGKRL